MRTQSLHIFGGFEKAMSGLEADIQLMAALAENSLRRAMKALITHDEELCDLVIGADPEIDALEKQVDRAGVAILARFNPVASDLRMVISIMKVAGHLERVADHSVSIARQVKKVDRDIIFQEISHIQPLFTGALNIVHHCMKSFSETSFEDAIEVNGLNQLLDEEDREFATHALERMKQQRERIPVYLNLLLVARHLRHVGDHAKDIVDATYFAVFGDDIRHKRLGPHTA